LHKKKRILQVFFLHKNLQNSCASFLLCKSCRFLLLYLLFYFIVTGRTVYHCVNEISLAAVDMCYIVRLSGPITRDICMYSQRNPAEIAFNPHASTRTDRHVTSLSRAMTRSWRQFLVYIGSRSSKSVGARMMMPNVPTKVTVVNSQKINRSSTIDTNCQSCFTCVQRYTDI